MLFLKKLYRSVKVGKEEQKSPPLRWVSLADLVLFQFLYDVF